MRDSRKCSFPSIEMKGFLHLIASNKMSLSYHIYVGDGVGIFLIRLTLKQRRVLNLQGDRNIMLMRLIESKLLSMDFNKGNQHKSVRLII